MCETLGLLHWKLLKPAAGNTVGSFCYITSYYSVFTQNMALFIKQGSVPSKIIGAIFACEFLA